MPLTEDTVSKEQYKPQGSMNKKSPSIVSTGSSMSFDKRKAMDRFYKITSFGATIGMMGNIMDFQSLKNSSIQVSDLNNTIRLK